jgi:hypothetical protein
LSDWAKPIDAEPASSTSATHKLCGFIFLMLSQCGLPSPGIPQRNFDLSQT